MLSHVSAGRSLDDALASGGNEFGPRDRALMKAVCYGVLRERRLLEALLAPMLERPLSKEPEVHALLLAGLFQLRSLRVPVHAAVDSTVGATAILKKPWARGMVNAVLRRYLRERERLDALVAHDPAVRFSYPDWLAMAIRRDWPAQWQDVLAAGNVQGPLTLRVNRRRVTMDTYREHLRIAGFVARDVTVAPDALALERAAPVEELPGFAEGDVSVQDASAQLATPLLALEPGMRVLDACAAPGGKSAHALESSDVNLLALDSDEARLARVRETFSRLGLRAQVRCGDATRPGAWWDRQPYDRILVDAPCSGTGVIRRHPDIKWLRRESDIPALAGTQRDLLNALWPLLKPGGVMLYSACSILKAECEDVARRFLAEHEDARDWPIDARWGERCTVGRRIPPGGDFDGFYYARFRRLSS